jgi:5'-phosphate synthase pdxT subunit
MPPAEPSVVGVLALQGDVAEHLRALEQAGARPLAVRRQAELDEAAGLIIPGGESTTIWKLTEIFGLAGPLRKRVASGMPVFGSCAGMIMLADLLVDPASGQETLGAIDMAVRRNAFGRQVDSFETDLSIIGLDGGPAGGGTEIGDRCERGVLPEVVGLPPS